MTSQWIKNKAHLIGHKIAVGAKLAWKERTKVGLALLIGGAGTASILIFHPPHLVSVGIWVVSKLVAGYFCGSAVWDVIKTVRHSKPKAANDNKPSTTQTKQAPEGPAVLPPSLSDRFPAASNHPDKNAITPAQNEKKADPKDPPRPPSAASR